MVGREGPSGLSDHPIRFLNQSFTSLADYCDARHLFDRKRKGPALRRGLSGYDTRGPRLDQKSMPPMPPMPGAAGSSFFASSPTMRSEEHTSELQSREKLVCRLPREKKKMNNANRS